MTAITHAVIEGGTLTRFDGAHGRRRPSAGLMGRSLLLGWAAGARASLGLAGPTITGGHHPVVRAGAALGVLGELLGDKLPSAPSRLAHGGALPRVASGVIGAIMLAARDQARPLGPALAGAAGSLAGAYGGVAWRGWAVGRVPDWQAAVAEDVVALTAAALACVPRRDPLWRAGGPPGTVGGLAGVHGPRRRRLSSVGRASHS